MRNIIHTALEARRAKSHDSLPPRANQAASFQVTREARMLRSSARIKSRHPDFRKDSAVTHDELSKARFPSQNSLESSAPQCPYPPHQKPAGPAPSQSKKITSVDLDMVELRKKNAESSRRSNKKKMGEIKVAEEENNTLKATFQDLSAKHLELKRTLRIWEEIYTST
jgi:hypothetical protein